MRGKLLILSGLTIIGLCEILLFIDVHRTGRGAIRTNTAAAIADVNEPHNWLGNVTRFAAINMTPLAWLGYVVFLDGVLAAGGNSPSKRRPNHFALCALASILIWCCFDVINFYCFKPPAWTYIGVAISWPQRFLGYAVAFAAELPAMFMTAQVILNFGWFDRARGPAWKLPKGIAALISLTGLAMLLWPILSGDAKANYTLWTSLVLLLDPINLMLGRPSILRDWQRGWYGRTLALFCGGLGCGFLWEFWNYWALAKWIYHLPFLGAAQGLRYFEMPLPGLLGFIPFGMECWVMWQTLRIVLDGLAEPLPSERDIL
jgi:hypothetical protein